MKLLIDTSNMNKQQLRRLRLLLRDTIEQLVSMSGVHDKEQLRLARNGESKQCIEGCCCGA